ncbi:MAG: response regulator [Bradyrhizobium sp.]|uniref:response regulator n=1 Tax=Bradyrhizobium sp. TaxID=376 RepID=UPI001DA7EB61|nr:response regulator [Bradyrhizobium sp.]MBV9561710.1 response regulator [Bradyrhizobium sp.]
MTHILFIDDDTAIRDAVELLLTTSGFTVAMAENGRAGLALYQSCKPDLIVTDVLMPDMEGIETIIHLRKLDPAVPIVAISGGWKSDRTGGLGPLDLARMIGATITLPKPFSGEDFLGAVQYCGSHVDSKASSDAHNKDAAGLGTGEPGP